MSRVDYAGVVLQEKYRITRLLGEGGMGAVYEGQHTIIGRKVAVKFLHSELTASEEVVRRFYREAQAAAAIGHSNIIDIYDVGVSGQGEPYLVMEYLEGESLADIIRRSAPLNPGAASAILEPALQALAAAHEKGIVHRDLKPENIFITYRKGQAPVVKLIDFGISKMMLGDDGTKLTATGSLLGTPLYMSPEQARGASDIDHRTDIYSTGVIFYEMLTGGQPFTGPNYNALLVSILTEEPRSPKDIFEGFSAECEPVIMKCIQKDPADRFQTALEMLAAVKELSTFETRHARLGHLLGEAEGENIAGGGLGEEISTNDAGEMAAGVLTELEREATPGAFAGTVKKESGFRMPGMLMPGMRRRTPAVIIAVAIALLIVILAWPGSPEKVEEGESGAVSVPAESSPVRELIRTVTGQSDSVEITVQGAPENAKIYYENSLVPVNPFKVKSKDTLSKLRIEAKGYVTYRVSIVPNEDQVVKAKMRRFSRKKKKKGFFDSISDGFKKLKKK